MNSPDNISPRIKMASAEPDNGARTRYIDARDGPSLVKLNPNNPNCNGPPNVPKNAR